MKKKYIRVLTALFMFIIIFLGYGLYKDKKMYEEHISIDVYNDMNSLVRSIVESNEIYNRILDKGTITRYDAERLKMNAYTIQEIPQTYGSLAYSFNRIKRDDFQNITAEPAAQIAAYFAEMNKDQFTYETNLDEVIVELHKETEENIIQLRELHALWVDAVLNNVVGVTDNNGEIDFSSQQFGNHYVENSLSHDFWIKLVLDIDKNTSSFLNDNRFISIQDILH